MKNQLTEKTIRSIFNYTMECNQIVNEMLRKLVNREDISFHSIFDSNDEEESDAKIISKEENDLRETQQQILNRLNIEGIHYILHKDNEIPLESGKALKWVSLIYQNTDSFINFIQTKIRDLDREKYCLHLHENFLSREKDIECGSSLRLCYCFQYIKDTPAEMDDSEVSIRLDCIDIITNYIKECFNNCDVTKQIQIQDKYISRLKVCEDGSTNISSILNNIREEAKDSVLNNAK